MAETREQEIQILRDWICKQQHLPNLPDDQLLLFLHSCYYSIERTKEAIDACFTVKTHTPEIFTDRDPDSPRLQAALDLVDFAVLPVRDSKGQKLVWTRMKDFDASKFVFEDVTKAAFLQMELFTKADPLVPGYVIVLDVTGFSLGHATRINLTTVRKLLIYVQEGMPLRMKEVHLLNTNSAIEKIFNFVKPFLNKEIINMIHLHHGDNENFYENFGYDLMPEDYGGKQKSISALNDEIRKMISESKEYVKEEEKWRIDESKRSEKFKSREDLFGMEGSFKKLSID